jgi:molybdopterin-biosynthesis enzyme MoeA-like protein
MAKVVEGCTELLPCCTTEGQRSPFPLMRVDGNIYVLPGVPSIMRSKWHCVRECLVGMYSWKPESFRNRFGATPLLHEALLATIKH